MKRISCFLLAIMSCSIFVANAQPLTLSYGIPAKENFSAERLARIDKIIQQYVDSGWINGGIALVAKNGHIVYHKAIGYDDVTSKKPLQKDAIFRIASQTKAITSVAVMQLVESGDILLNDPVYKYIPAFRMPRVVEKFNSADSSYTSVPAKRELTIRDLLTHTSGIGYAQIGNDTMTMIYSKAGVVGGIGLKGGLLADNILALAKLPLQHQPGERWTYGLNSDVLGYLVEVVSGMNLNDYFSKYIFAPIGMKDTYFYLPKAKQARLAMLFTEDGNKHAIKMNEKIRLNGDFYRDYPNLAGGSFYSGVVDWFLPLMIMRSLCRCY